VRRPALLALLAIVPLVGCSHGEASPATQLTLEALNPSVGRAVFRLECEPAGGDLPDPAAACAALAKVPRLITSPKPFTCHGGTFSWWEITIAGRLDGEPIRRSFSTCWTPQMETLGRLAMSWDVLREHLLPRRRETVLAGTERVFPPSVLRSTDVITCDIRGRHLETGVPVETGPDARASAGYGGANVVDVTLAVTHRRDGSVAASCRTGGS
jgi:hypothetical protein